MSSRFSLDDFTAHAGSLESPDELSVYIGRQLMRQYSPSLLWITLHDIDIAHSGAYSLYLDGIRRSDRLCTEIWRAIESDPEYKGRTTMFTSLISVATPISVPGAMAFSITVLAMHYRAPPG